MLRPDTHPSRVTFPSDFEAVITRTFNASRELVYAASTQPEHVRRWYGLRHHTMPVCEIDLRPGGRWRYVLKDREGNEFGFSGEYLELEPPGRMVYTEGFEAMPGHDYVVTATLTEEAGRTTLEARLRYRSREDRDGHFASGMESGMRESHDRLEEVLLEATGGATPRDIMLKRFVDASRDLVWEAFTDPAHLVNWWGPEGFTNTFQEIDIRPGGTWRFVMHGPDGTDYDNHIVFDVIEKPSRIEFDHGPAPVFRSTITLEEVDGRTLVTMTARLETPELREQIATYAVDGGRSTLNRLAALVEGIVAAGAR